MQPNHSFFKFWFSFFRSDFQVGTRVKGNHTQCISPRVRAKSSKSVVDESRRNFSEYKRNYSHGQPNPSISTNFSTGYNRVESHAHHPTHELMNTSGKINRQKQDQPLLIKNARRARTAPVRYSVGDCLVWDLGRRKTQNEVKPSDSLPNMTPNATKISSFHPPHPPQVAA